MWRARRHARLGHTSRQTARQQLLVISRCTRRKKPRRVLRKGTTSRGANRRSQNRPRSGRIIAALCMAGNRHRHRSPRACDNISGQNCSPAAGPRPRPAFSGGSQSRVATRPTIPFGKPTPRFRGSAGGYCPWKHVKRNEARANPAATRRGSRESKQAKQAPSTATLHALSRFRGGRCPPYCLPTLGLGRPRCRKWAKTLLCGGALAGYHDGGRTGAVPVHGPSRKARLCRSV